MRRFFYRENLIGSDFVQHFFNTARPANLQVLDEPVLSQAKVYSAVAGRGVSDRRCHLVPLGSAIFRRNVNLRAYAHPIAFCSDELEENPVIASIGDVPQNFNRPPKNGNYGVDATIVKEIPKGDATMRCLFLEVRSS